MFDDKNVTRRTIMIDGEKTPIDPDFRLMCRLYSGENVLKDFYFAGLPVGVSMEKAVEAMLDFYLDGIAPYRDREKHEESGEKPLPVFDFAEDEALFYAAFLGEYGVDLNRAKLHWFDFCALFKGLPDECRLKQVIQVRSTKMSDVPKYDRKRIAHLKQVYALKKVQSKKYATAKERDEDMKARIDRRYAEAQRKTGVKVGD